MASRFVRTAFASAVELAMNELYGAFSLTDLHVVCP